MNKRKPGNSNISSSRNESDKIIIQSGLKDNITLASPICIQINNVDQKSKDYNELNDVFYVPFRAK